jgi:TonB-linked SusC/RagA family outer membrane protein
MKTKLSGILTLLLAFVVQVTFAQERTITGTVSDETGPLPGVSILIEGTSSGTETDFDGNYSIEAKSGDVLRFSFVGMTTITRTVGADSSVSVTMVSEANTLDEVIVTGYGRKVEQRSTTIAVQELDGDSFVQAKEANVANALSGKISGVQVTSSSGAVGASSRVLLRGASSITGNNEPLYVVDGVFITNSTNGSSAGPFGGRDLPNSAADINPEDIESLVVLKGPAAAALYGSFAANGVIVITTRAGKKSKKMGVTFSSNLDFQTPLILPAYQNSYGQGGNQEYFEFIDGQSGDGGIDESWGPPLDVGLEFVQWNSYQVGGEPLPWVSQKDNIKDFYDVGSMITNNIAFDGGSEDITYRVSVGNMDQEGMVPFTDFSRFNIGANSSYTINEKFTTNVNVNYVKSHSDNLPQVGYDNENPIQQFIWSGRNVDFQALKNWRDLPLAADGTAAAGTPLNWNTVFQNNPYWVLETNTNDFDKHRIYGNVGLNYAISKNWNVNGKIGIDHYNSISTRRQAFGSNNAPNGSYREDVRSGSITNLDLFVNYKTDFKGSDFNLDLTAGGSRLRFDDKINAVTAPQLQLPNLYDLNNLRAGSNYTITDYTGRADYNSLIGYGTVSWRNMIFIDFTARNDWASILPEQENSYFYPSVTGSAVISELFGASGNQWYLKVRGGWAQVGSVRALGPYSVDPTYALSAEPFGTTTVGFLPGTLNNPNIKSETTEGIEFGADLQLFNNRVRINATYYDQTSKDLIVPVQISAASGVTNVISNVGEMRNKGYEITFGWDIVRGNDWRVGIEANFAQNENMVVSLGGLDALVLGGQWNMTLEAREGEPYGSIVGNYFERTPSGEILYNNGLPVLGAGTKILGNVTPDWTGGLALNVSYKNWSFYGLVDAKIGGDIHSMTTTWGNFAGALSGTIAGRESGIVGNGEMLDANGNYVPNNVVRTAEAFNKQYYSNSIVESAVFDASYVKLRQLMLTYTLPKKYFQNAIIDDLQFSVVGRNLAILYKNAPHIDPESAFSSNNGDQGQEFGQIPSARSLGFNVRIKL